MSIWQEAFLAGLVGGWVIYMASMINRIVDNWYELLGILEARPNDG